MSNLRELKAAMPLEFVNQFKETAKKYGLTQRQLSATCIAFGYKIFCCTSDPISLPSEPSPVADPLAEKAAVSRVAEGDGAKRSLPFTLKAAFEAKIRNKRGSSEEG